MSFDAERVAELIMETRLRRGRMKKLPPDVAPTTAAEGASAQAALARRTGAMPPAGFKIGATAKRMQNYLGLSGPVAGFMPSAGLHPSGVALPFASFTNPGVECELLVRLARDLPPGPCTQEQARAAVGALFAGIEIVENRYADDLAAIGVPSLMADQVYHAACIAGDPPPDWQALDVAALAGRMTVNGEFCGEGLGADLLGHPLNSLAWLAGSVEAAAFGGLRAGQVVMLGSVTPPIWLDGPSTVTVAFTSLPPVEVRLT
ncbi:MAG: hypothetical protein J0H14_14000 [Alphaproteobacteria bacterium]|nr:hypothetical protein [Alphaproteobacteria bacterium]